MIVLKNLCWFLETGSYIHWTGLQLTHHNVEKDLEFFNLQP